MNTSRTGLWLALLAGVVFAVIGAWMVQEAEPFGWAGLVFGILIVAYNLVELRRAGAVPERPGRVTVQPVSQRAFELAQARLDSPRYKARQLAPDDAARIIDDLRCKAFAEISIDGIESTCIDDGASDYYLGYATVSGSAMTTRSAPQRWG